MISSCQTPAKGRLGMMIGFGIDLAGYVTGKTSLAFTEIEGRFAKATLLRGSALSRKRKSSDSLAEALANEVAVLGHCLGIASVAVDVPIDLQGLPNAQNPQAIWPLTRRPIDYALNAMPPLADRIGAPVARFAAIMRYGNFYPLLGIRLFEAYPAITLKQCKFSKFERVYKGKAHADGLVSLCKALKVKPHVRNDDDIDAVICAIAAATPNPGICHASDLKVQCEMPKGFRVPKNLAFEKIEITESDYSAWIQARKVSA